MKEGCKSASTSRRTSRERRCSDERRYRSESRLGRRTPEPTRLSTGIREEHRSLRDKEEVEGDSARPQSAASEQTRTRDSSVDRDLNSNHTNSGGQSESADQVAVVNTTEHNDQTKKSNEEVKIIKVKEISNDGKDKQISSTTNVVSSIKHDFQTSKDDTQESNEDVKINKVQETNNDGKDKQTPCTTNVVSSTEYDCQTSKDETKKSNEEVKVNKEQESDKGGKDKQLPSTTNVVSSTIANQTQTKEITKQPQVVESKEDKVREIKEIDSKEPVNDISKTNVDFDSIQPIQISFTDQLITSSVVELSKTIQHEGKPT